MKTRVTFPLTTPRNVTSQPNYESLGITTVIENGQLTEIQTFVEHQSSAGHEEIVQQALSVIAPLLTLIEFGVGGRLTLAAASTNQFEPDSPITISLGFATGAEVIRAIAFPSPTDVASLTNVAMRLLNWFNDGESDASPITKIRAYYNVLEFENNLSSSTAVPYKPPDEMRWLRDAVSHPELRNPDVVRYLQQHLGTDHVDPNNPAHLQFLTGKVPLLRNEALRMLQVRGFVEHGVRSATLASQH